LHLTDCAWPAPHPAVTPPVRHRTAPTSTRPPNRRDATTPAFRPPLRREVSLYAYASIPCWWSAERWMEHVARVYKRSYLLLRPRLVTSSGGGISLPTVLAYAAAQAAAADHRTGRGSWPSIAGMATSARRGRRTIQRARLFLRLAGLATEIQPGRTRTYPERITSWERGDRARGWTAVYALHPSPTYPDPVDNSRIIRPGQTHDGTPPRSGSLSHSASAEKRFSTRDNDQRPPAGDEDGAPRRASTKTGCFGRGTNGTRAPGTALMLAWRTDPACPGWARAYAAHRWAGSLTGAVEAGWTTTSSPDPADPSATSSPYSPRSTSTNPPPSPATCTPLPTKPHAPNKPHNDPQNAPRVTAPAKPRSPRLPAPDERSPTKSRPPRRRVRLGDARGAAVAVEGTPGPDRSHHAPETWLQRLRKIRWRGTQCPLTVAQT